MGIKVSELDSLNFGDVIDMITEAANDDYQYSYKANQDDFDRF